MKTCFRLGVCLRASMDLSLSKSVPEEQVLELSVKRHSAFPSLLNNKEEEKKKKHQGEFINKKHHCLGFP